MTSALPADAQPTPEGPGQRTAEPQPDGPRPAEDEPRVDVYWRPGCPFCSGLFRSLRQAGLPMRELNIWEDPDAAAFVRAHAGGNETVPTVDVAGTVMVNPPGKVVLARAAEAGIALSPAKG